MSAEPAGFVFQQLDKVSPAPYTRAEYRRRAVWLLVQHTLFRVAPNKLRLALVRLFGGVIDPTAMIRPSANIRHPWLLTMGKHAAIGNDVEVYNLGPISIGDHSVVSQNVHLCAGTHDYKKPNLPLRRVPIQIERGVWVCADAFIGPGVRIGDNAIVGARAVVTREVPAGVIVAGNPAEVVRERPMPKQG